MNINFESDFLTSMSKYKIKDQYYDEYLKTTRYHLLTYNNLSEQYSNYTNNNIVNDNKYTFIHVDEIQKESILSKIKILILKQKKLKDNLLYHYKLVNPDLLKIDNDNASIKSTKSIKSIDSSNSSKSSFSIKSTKSTKSTKLYRIDRKKDTTDTLSLNEHQKKTKFTFFTRKNK